MEMSVEHWGNTTDRGKRKNSPSATLSTTNLMWTDLGSNLRLCDVRPGTNGLRHDTTLKTNLIL